MGGERFGLEKSVGIVGMLSSASASPWKELEHSRTNSEPVTPSEDDVAEAERLKTEGTKPLELLDNEDLVLIGRGSQFPATWN